MGSVTGAIQPRVAGPALLGLASLTGLACLVGVACSSNETSDPDAGVVDAAPLPSSCQVAECGRFSQCVEENGTARCACLSGYQGARCTDCAPSLQDRNGDGVCEPACAAGTCPFRANCDDSTGLIVCRCEPGYVMQGSECVADGTVPAPSGRAATPELVSP